MKKYESVLLRNNFSLMKTFNEKFQELLDEYSKKGWFLHSFQFDADKMCVVVFEKDI